MCHCAPVLRIHRTASSTHESESACVQHAHREYAPPENASECAPTVRPSAESFLIYSGSTVVGNFEIGSSQLRIDGETELISWEFYSFPSEALRQKEFGELRSRFATSASVTASLRTMLNRRSSR